MQPSTRNWLIGGGAFVAALFYWLTYIHVSVTEVSRYGKQCSDWISEEVNNGQETRLGEYWKKRGKLVFEVLATNKNKNTYSVFLCVIDKSKGTMLKPSAFDTSWN